MNGEKKTHATNDYCKGNLKARDEQGKALTMTDSERIDDLAEKITALCKKEYGERDPERIDGTTKRIGELWKEHGPDLRFGQLMMGFNSWHTQTFQRDFFYLEDDELLSQLEAYLSQTRPPSQRES